MLLSITIISTVIAFIEGLPLMKKRMWKELITLLILLLTSIILAGEKVLNIPNPVNLINNLLQPFGKIIFKSL